MNLLLVVPEQGEAVVYAYRERQAWLDNIARHRQLIRDGSLRASILPVVGDVCVVGAERESIKLQLPGTEEWVEVESGRESSMMITVINEDGEQPAEEPTPPVVPAVDQGAAADEQSGGGI